MFISIGMAALLIWLAPRIVNAQFDTVDGHFTKLQYSQVGLKHRIWHSDFEGWPWDDHFPEDSEGVSGSWAGIPFPAAQRRVEHPNPPLYISNWGFPDYYQLNEFHKNLDLFRPHWVGLIADTLFWAGIAWVMRCVWRTVLARRRIRQGRCPRCSYDLSGLENAECCPECGERCRSKTATRPSTRS